MDPRLNFCTKVAAQVENQRNAALAVAAHHALGAEGGIGRIDTASGSFTARLGRGVARGDAALLFVRPENLHLGAAASAAGNRIDARFSHAEFEGNFVNAVCTGGDRKPLTAQTRSDPAVLALAPGTPTALGFAAADGIILPAGELARE